VNLNFDIPELRVPQSTRRYRAKIAFVSPQVRRTSFESEAECFLGVSLENRNFELARFHALLEWVTHRFQKCKILIGDSIHRITLEARSRISPEAALPVALRLGHQFMTEHKNLIESYRDITNFEFVTCREIQATRRYDQYSQEIRNYFQQVPEFKASVEAFGRHYHRNRWENVEQDQREYQLQRSCDYFLEEFAVFACFVDDGNSVMIYPGSFSTLAEIADGLFPGVTPELQALTVVSIQLKRRYR